MENQTDHIQQIVDTALSNIKKATEVSTIIGQPLITSDGSTILPISQVSFGFLAGGGEYGNSKVIGKKDNQFAGGTGGGATMVPIGFLVIKKGKISMLKINNDGPTEKLIDLTKDILGRFKS